MLDATSWKILQALQENARLTYAELAKRVNLTAPAVAERVRKLEEAGIITGYHAAVNPIALGRSIVVLIHLAVPAERERRLIEFLKERNEVLEVYNVAGKDSFIIKVAVSSVVCLNRFLEVLSGFGQTTTHFILEHTIPPRPLTDIAGKTK